MGRCLAFSLLLAVSLACAQKPKPATPADQLIGIWKYEVTTLKVEPNAKTKAAMNDPKTGKQAKEMMSRLQKSLATMLKPLKLTFKSDMSFVISTLNPNEKRMGTWNIHDRHVHVVMTDGGQATPEMEIDKTGKRIHATYSDPDFGLAKVDLVRG
jgi:hypothetical protein